MDQVDTKAYIFIAEAPVREMTSQPTLPLRMRGVNSRTPSRSWCATIVNVMLQLVTVKILISSNNIYYTPCSKNTIIHS